MDHERGVEWPYPPWIRIASVARSRACPEATIFAIPDSL